jgi:high-affinity nickel-transport protein
MGLVSILALGFFLGMRHATDSDHVVAVSTIVSRERSVMSASLVGVLWGLGHSLTILIVGGAIILFGVVLPAKVGLTMELSVALMLVVLGVLNVSGFRRDVRAMREHRHDEGDNRSLRGLGRYQALRSLAVGIVHGLAGSAAVALLVLATIRNAAWAMLYLLLFGVGTVAGMMLITSALAVPLAYSAQRFAWSRHLGWITGVVSVGLGLFLVYRIGVVDGLLLGAR